MVKTHWKCCTMRTKVNNIAVQQCECVFVCVCGRYRWQAYGPLLNQFLMDVRKFMVKNIWLCTMNSQRVAKIIRVAKTESTKTKKKRKSLPLSTMSTNVASRKYLLPLTIPSSSTQQVGSKLIKGKWGKGETGASSLALYKIFLCTWKKTTTTIEYTIHLLLYCCYFFSFVAYLWR